MTRRHVWITAVAAIVGGVLIGYWPMETVGVAGAFCVTAILLHRRTDPRVVISTAFFCAVLIPELAILRTAVPLAGTSIYIPHVLLVLALPFVSWSELLPTFRRLLVGYVGLIAWMAVLGLSRGAAIVPILQDVGGPLTFIGGVVCGLLLYQQRGLVGLLTLVPFILGISVVLVGLHVATGGAVLGGRVAAAEGFGGVGRAGTAIDATRFIVSSEDLAVAALLVVFWWFTQQRSHQPSRELLVFVVACSVSMIVLSLSRQLIVGLGVGCFGWLLVRQGISRVFRMAIAAIPFVIAAVLVLSLLTLGGWGIGSETFVGRQTDAFAERVIDGLTSESIQQDAGTSWRQRENAIAIDVIREQPFGTGFGRPYRDEFTIEAFGDPTFFRRWVHNVYLWYGTKGGILGLVAVGLVTVVPFAVALRRARRRGYEDDPVSTVAVPILLSFGVMSLVDPVIINSNSGAITGALFALVGLRDRPRHYDYPTILDPSAVDRERESAGIGP